MIFTFGHDKEQVVNMLDSNSFKKYNRQVILIQNDTFLVLTSDKLFIENYNKYLKKNKDVENDKMILKVIKSDTSNTIYLNNIMKIISGKHLLDCILVDILEKGNCVVFNKQTKKIEKKIYIDKYYPYSQIRIKFFTKPNHLIFDYLMMEYITF